MCVCVCVCLHNTLTLDRYTMKADIVRSGEEARWQLHKNAACNPEQVLAATPHKTPTVRPPTPYHENYPS